MAFFASLMEFLRALSMNLDGSRTRAAWIRICSLFRQLRYRSWLPVFEPERAHALSALWAMRT